MGRHSGWTVVLASQTLHSKMESANPLRIKLELSQIKSNSRVSSQTEPVDRSVCDVVVDELAPLHHHERVTDVRRRDVVVDVDGHQPGTGQRRAVH